MKNSTKVFFFLTVMIIMVITATSAFALNNTHDNLETAGFVPEQRGSYSDLYTQIRVGGYDYPVFCFETAEGTAFRVYGHIGKNTGYYPVNVEVADAGTETQRFILSIADTEIAKTDNKLGIMLKNVPYPELPEGFIEYGKKGTSVLLYNIFGQKEYYTYGTYGDPEDEKSEFGWYRTEQPDKVYAKLKIDINDGKYRTKPDDVKKRQLPPEMKKGFSQNVEIKCSNGFTVTVPTNYPAIDYETLQAEIKQEQATKTGIFKEYEYEDIPFETEIRKNKKMYINEADNILQEGENGIREITYNVTYKDGVETKRTKAGTKVTKHAVKEILERGTLEPDESYVLSNNMSVGVKVNANQITPSDKLTVGVDIQVIGKKPEGGYTCTLKVEGPDGSVIKETTSNSGKPDTISLTKLDLGRHKITAQMTNKDGESIVSGTYVDVIEYIEKGTNSGTATEEKQTEEQPKQTPAPHIPVITIETVTESEDIPYKTEYFTDDSMYIDAAEVVVRNGITGKHVYTYEVTYEDGVQISKQLISDIISIEPSSKQIKRGTKQHTTETRTETRTETISIETTYIDDPGKYTDDPQEVISSGSEGERTIVYNVTYYDGVESSRTQVSSSVTREMVNRQVKRGTKQHIITYGEETGNQTIQYTTNDTYTDQLNVGEIIVMQDGRNGEKQVTYQITYTDGQETGRAVIAESIISNPVTEERYVGTFQPTYSYEYVSISLGGMMGSRDSGLDGICEGQAMYMAQNGVQHSGNGSYESVGGWSSPGEAAAGLVSHVPGLATMEFWGAGCVKATIAGAHGTSTHYFACAEGGGRAFVQDENGNWILPEYAQ